ATLIWRCSASTCAVVDVRAPWEGVATTTPFSAPSSFASTLSKIGVCRSAAAASQNAESHMRRDAFQPVRQADRAPQAPLVMGAGLAAADAKARSNRRQLPITGSAHKAGNGRRPLPAAT